MSNKVSVKIVHHSGGVCVRMITNRKPKYKKLFTLEKKYLIDGQVSSKHANYLKHNLLISKTLAEWNTKAINIQSGLEVAETDPKESSKVEAKLSDLIMDYARRMQRLGKYK